MSEDSLTPLPPSVTEPVEVTEAEAPVAEPVEAKLKALLASRKFWAALIGLLLLIVKAFRPDFPLAEDQITNIVYLLMAYILGTAIEDGGKTVTR